MKKIDLLKEVYNKKISENKAHELFEKILDTNPNRLYKLISFNKIESTAFLHGVNFMILAKWRYEGWPNKCAKCRKEIEIKKFAWLAKGKNSKFRIYHVKCLK